MNSRTKILKRFVLGVAAIALGAGILIYRRSAGPEDGSISSPTSPSTSGDWAGKVAPDFLLSRLDGRNVRLSDYHGKVVIVNFWATWCAPCRIEMPWLVEFYQRYHAQGLEILGVSVDDGDRDRVAKFVAEEKVNYTILLKDDTIADAYGGLRFLPQTFFVDRDGKIIKRTYGIREKIDFENDIRSSLGTAQPAR